VHAISRSHTPSPSLFFLAELSPTMDQVPIPVNEGAIEDDQYDDEHIIDHHAHRNSVHQRLRANRRVMFAPLCPASSY
jgi:hypothetical protein